VLKKFVSVLFIINFIVFVSGCASYRAGSYPTKDILAYSNIQERGDLKIAAKFLDTNETRQSFQRNLQDQGIEPVFLIMDNRSKDTYNFSKSMVNRNVIQAEEVAHRCRFGTGKRVASYGVLAILCWPFLIPAIIDGFGSSGANTRMRDDYIFKQIKDERIFPMGLLTGFLYIEKLKPGEDLIIRLQNISSSEVALFRFNK